MSSTQATAPPTSVLVVDAEGLGRLLGVSTRTIRTWDAGGKLPRPIRPGGHSVRWVVSEIEAWVAAGTPNRATWEKMKGERDGR